MKINTKSLCKMSLIIRKMEITPLSMKLKVETGDEQKDKEELAKELISLIICNLEKAENEIIDLIASMKEISREEAENTDVIIFIQELLQEKGIVDFLKLA